VSSAVRVTLLVRVREGSAGEGGSSVGVSDFAGIGSAVAVESEKGCRMMCTGGGYG
jgi:hypothetical protein